MFHTELFHDVNNIHSILLCHAGEYRKTDKSFPHPRSSGTVLRFPAERLLVVRVKVERSPMNRAAYPTQFEELDKVISVNIESVEVKLDRKEVP